MRDQCEPLLPVLCPPTRILNPPPASRCTRLTSLGITNCLLGSAQTDASVEGKALNGRYQVGVFFVQGKGVFRV